MKPWRQPPGPSSELLSSVAQELGSKTDLQFNCEMGYKLDTPFGHLNFPF